jgi:hypothetical protein
MSHHQPPAETIASVKFVSRLFDVEMNPRRSLMSRKVDRGALGHQMLVAADVLKASACPGYAGQSDSLPSVVNHVGNQAISPQALPDL